MTRWARLSARMTASESLIFQPANLNVREFMEHIGRDGRIILKFIFKNKSVGVRTGFSWHGIVSSGGLL
jgi:hypothetical protein